MPQPLLDAVEMIRREKVRGASWAFYTALRAIIESYEEGLLDCSDPERLARLVESANRSLATLANLAYEIRRTCPEGPKALVEAARTLLEVYSRSRTMLMEAGRQLGEAAIATLSYSSSVEAVLSGARGRVRRVVVFESRPGGEGALFAATLRSSGFDVSLAPDTMMPYWASKVDLVLVGADSVTMDGCVVNKLGTHQLILIASHYSTPRAVVLDPLRIHPTAGCEDLPIEERTYLAPGYGPVRYPLFDKTPLELFNAMVTSMGIQEARKENVEGLWRDVFG